MKTEDIGLLTAPPNFGIKPGGERGVNADDDVTKMVMVILFYM